MERKIIEDLRKKRNLRTKEIDKEKVISLLNAIEKNISAVKKINMNEDNSTIIFKEVYDAIRQIADAFWWLEGYEVLRDHDASFTVLKDIEVSQKFKINYIERFKKIRNDANYRGFLVSIEQAQEILDFWNSYGLEIMAFLKKKIDKIK